MVFARDDRGGDGGRPSGLLKRDDLGDAGGRAEAFARKAFSFEDVLKRFRTVFDVDKPAG